jgi:hypothetical protein
MNQHTDLLLEEMNRRGKFDRNILYAHMDML